MILTIKDNQIGAFKWLTLKGMEETKSDSRYEAFLDVSDQLHDRTLVGEHNIVLKINKNISSITVNIYVNGKFFTEIGCTDLVELFEILSNHEIVDSIND